MLENTQWLEFKQHDLLEDVQEIRDKYLVKNKLIVNHEEKNFLDELKQGLSECTTFYMSVAFINFSGLQLLLDAFKELEERGIKGKILTSTYLNFTEPKALEKLKEFQNIDLKIFVATKEMGFHTKAYIFENEKEYKIIIGSSNITQRALKSNIEWNVRVISKKEDHFAKEVILEYLILWKRTSIVDEKFLTQYNAFIKKIHRLEKTKEVQFDEYQILTPNVMQKRAVENLVRLRQMGETKALVVAATGTGKTYMSAFDVIAYHPKRMLFLVHREDILRSAEKTFRGLLRNKDVTTGIFTGTQKQAEADCVFATVHSMHLHLDKFDKDAFEYIIVDEAHHATSPSYQKILTHFKSKFLLGMTATPERCDTGDVFEVFDHNLALEVRLHEALDLELIVPFHYFGITDISGVDLSNIAIDDVVELSKRLKLNKRVDFIVEKMLFYGQDGQKRKALGFCVTIDHAMYMAQAFNQRGIPSTYLTGEHSVEQRKDIVARLEDEEDPLEVIFTVDIFNEGVDIPGINLVLMLRPTNSPIIFIQQLGRGLRKHEEKSFLTVLDFIGNHKKVFLIAIALSGSRYYDKDSLKVAVANGFGDIPGCTHIQMDRIAQENILAQLNTENFHTMKYLKEEYQAFKAMNGGRIPYLLEDYLKYDGAPNPIRFIEKEKTYLSFIQKVEKDERLVKLLIDEVFIKILKELSGKLPLKRPHEFIIINYLTTRDEISLEQAIKEIRKYVQQVEENSVVHAMQCLSRAYYDSVQIKNTINCFTYDKKLLVVTKAWKQIVEQKNYLIYIKDVVQYGLRCYANTFGDTNYGIPFFKLYEQYQMVDAAKLSLYNKIHSAFRGQGLLTNGKEYFLFIDLHKEETIKESINYKDKFINQKYFQWQTPNSTAQSSERGKNIICNQERGIHLHLFVRKYKEIDGKVQPYIYIGRGNTVQFEGEKPITIVLALEYLVPKSIYTEFIQKV